MAEKTLGQVAEDAYMDYGLSDPTVIPEQFTQFCKDSWQAAALAVRREVLEEAVAIALGCKDYGGGYRPEPALLEAFHHGMETVARCLQKRIDDPNDFQSRVVLSIGRRALKDQEPGNAA